MAAREKKPTELVKGIQDRPKAVQGPKNVKNLAAVKHSNLRTLSTVLDDEVIKDVVPLDHPVPYKQEKEVSYPSAKARVSFNWILFDMVDLPPACSNELTVRKDGGWIV
ncbi:hypothetical protein IFR04_004141 [Cadophora malorum]|uniref:Uncharacterized protein n=1 Tax=Cadophora malorum TaxID=108018 RepID=A0A8H8BT72_9HELO|nr:hypothetical protein IFR04_004141 [Cadophora malorum]